jgi:hypothetical protein
MAKYRIKYDLSWGSYIIEMKCWAFGLIPYWEAIDSETSLTLAEMRMKSFIENPDLINNRKPRVIKYDR